MLYLTNLLRRPISASLNQQSRDGVLVTARAICCNADSEILVSNYERVGRSGNESALSVA
jgi:hypothetical protein